MGILGVGHFAPEEMVTNDDLARLVDTTDEWITERTGIKSRRRASADQATSDLAYQAARKALDQAGVKAEELDLIIVATVTPDRMVPPCSCELQALLGATRAGAFDLNIACSGFAYGLAVGSQFIKSGTMKRVLVVGGDILTRMTDWSDRATCILFGDGAGAAVLGEVKPGFGLLGMELGADGRGADLLHVPGGGSRKPGWTEPHNPSDYYLKMEGREVFRFAVTKMAEAALLALDNAKISPEEVQLFIPHQANLRVIEAARKKLSLPPERVFTNLQHYGNTSSGSIPVALSEAHEQGLINEGDVVIMVGFGAGLSWGAVVVRWGGRLDNAEV